MRVRELRDWDGVNFSSPAVFIILLVAVDASCRRETNGNVPGPEGRHTPLAFLVILVVVITSVLAQVLPLVLFGPECIITS